MDQRKNSVNVYPPAQRRSADALKARLMVLGVLLWFSCGAAWAQSAPPAGVNVTCRRAGQAFMNLGSWSPFYSGARSGYGKLHYACRRTGTAVVSEPVYVKICLGIGNGSGGAEDGWRRMRYGNISSVLYQMYKDSTFSQVVTPTITENSPAFSAPLPNVNTDYFVNVPVVALVPLEQTNPIAAIHRSDFTHGAITIKYGAYTGGEPACTSPLIHQSLVNSHLWRAEINISATCKLVSMPGIDFGVVSPSPLNAPLEKSTVLTVKCTRDTDYTIYARIGKHYDHATQTRNMAYGDHRIPYELCRGSSCIEGKWWSPEQTQRLSGKGSGYDQVHEVSARVNSIPNTAAPGTYTDTVVVTMEY